MDSVLITGDALKVLKQLPTNTIDTCVTSPPYWGLRDYGVEGQIGLEETPEQYICKLIEVFKEVRRVLRTDGTLWLNLGDSYSGSGKGIGNKNPRKEIYTDNDVTKTNWKKVNLKPKNLVGIPWRVALALQGDGWYLRQDIIWNKPNAMPESVKDRCTKAHEYIFLFSKEARYYFNAEAIKEPAVGLSNYSVAGSIGAFGSVQQRRRKGSAKSQGNMPKEIGLRNKRSVWNVATASCKEAHFATFPPSLIKPCIRAGCRKGGTVLDPFFGTGTTGIVAQGEGCNYIGIEINPKYVEMANKNLELG